ncbi:hypothetical protein [Serratia phage PCH45]|uniref:hypothetical protein n=1 Tax=Serratia phage PCH45 TaxID=2608368 RepID=UPI0012A9DE3E|nr:hypothetical protein [Serratia phage PCH45]
MGRVSALISGQVCGRLTIVRKLDERMNNRPLWECRCQCGKVIKVLQQSLVSGNTKSCGCFRKEALAERRGSHQLSEHPLYHVWYNMKNRCNNPNHEHYHRYGGRGITYDPSFETIEGFLAGIPEGYRKGLELDRIDNDGNYEPGNLRWATRREQVLNSSATTKVTDPYTNETMSITSMAKKYGIPYYTLHQHVTNGHDILEVLETVKKKRVQK